MIILLFFIFMISLCWGSFLNVIACRIAYDKPFFTKRSYCFSCKNTIAFYDNIPIISWLLLGGSCRTCKAPITWIYPFIETTTAILMTTLILRYVDLKDITIINPASLLTYIIFLSALIIATATDLHAMVIPQLVSVWLIPVGIIATLASFTSITIIESLIGIILGYGLLWGIAWLFKKCTSQDGIGEGDMELLAMIGSFIGFKGVWFSVMSGSIIGLITGSLYLCLAGKHSKTPIPFGPSLALGAVIFLFFEPYVTYYILGGYW